MKVDQTLFKYFKESLSKGHTIDQLKKSCLEQGYIENDINIIISEINSEKKTSEFLSFKLFLVPTLIITLILVILIFLKSNIPILRIFYLLSIIITFIFLFKSFWKKKYILPKDFFISSLIFNFVIIPIYLSLIHFGLLYLDNFYLLKSQISIVSPETNRFMIIIFNSLFVIYSTIISLFFTKNIFYILSKKTINKTGLYLLNLLLFIFSSFIFFIISINIWKIISNLLFGFFGNYV
jgi:hypothetical protein